MVTQTPSYYFALLKALQIIAAPAEDQLRFFPSGVSVADELALSLSDALLLIDEEPFQQGIRQDPLKMMRALDATFEDLSNQPDKSFWSSSALRNDIRWQQARLAARNILRVMGEPIGPPSTDARYAVNHIKNDGRE
jgi:hypothetical protein